jgi:uncharacterized phage protein gp47/JayE
MRASGEYMLYGFLDWAFDQVFPDKAEKEYLEAWGKVWGIYRLAATSAEGEVIVAGSAGSSVPEGAIAIDSKGAQFKLSGGTLAGTSLTMKAVAVEPGKAGNLATGSKLTLVSPLLGIASEITAGPSGFQGGVEAEDDESLRARVIKTIQSPPHGGSKTDYETWALEVNGVKKALCIPLKNGLGTVGVAVWGDPENPILDGVILERAAEHIKKLAPVTSSSGLQVYTPAPRTVNVSLRISPDTPQTRANVEMELRDVFWSEGAPGTVIPLTHLAEAVSISAGEYDHKMFSPTADIIPTAEELPVLGTVTFIT